jgi:serine/threonine protein kinase
MGAAARPSDSPTTKSSPDRRIGASLDVRCIETGRRCALRIDALAGTGGMARVYAASTPENIGENQRVAVKILDREIGADPRVRDRFFREKELAMRVQHPARVPIELAATSDDGDAVLVMELVDGENLETVRRRLGGKLPLVPALRIAEETLDFLASCHAAGILHRDMKTANLLWAPGRAIRVVDFGIARCDAIGAVPELTLGTPSFMAPEQAGGIGEEDPRTDVFGVGAVLYTILLGLRLHRGRTHDESLFLAATQAAPPIEDESLPRDVAAVIARALAFQRDDRWPSALAMRDAIRVIRLREEARISVPPTPVEDDDGLSDATPALTSGVLLASRAPDARGTFGETPLPHLLVHVLARDLDGTLVVSHGDTREIVEFLSGAPIRRTAAAADDPIVGTLARITQMPTESSYRFYIDDRLRDSLGPNATRVEPLDAILTCTRRLRAQPAFRTRMRATLERLGDRPIKLHPKGAPARFGLSGSERAALDAALQFELTYSQLLEAAMAPRDVIDPVLYALGITRHLVATPGSAHPIGVPE